MAKKVRKRERRSIVDLLLGWNPLGLAVAILVIAAGILIFGLDEPGSILTRFLGEALLCGTALLAIIIVVLLIWRLSK